MKKLILYLAASIFCLNTQAQKYEWAKSIGGNGQDYGNSIAVDASGNVYVTGYFNNTADFDPGPGTVNLNSAGLTDIFFAKYDSNGNYIWAKAIGGTSSDQGRSIAVDAWGDVYITGYFRGANIEFNPGGASSVTLSSVGSSDVFFARYDSNGNCIWAKSIGGANTDEGMKISVNVIGDTYLMGSFSNATVDFDPGVGMFTLSSAGNYSDMFFAKYNNAGNFIWAKSIGSSSTGIINGQSMTIDASNNVYITGYFQNDIINFDPAGSATATLSPGTNGTQFFAKYDNSGNYTWAKAIDAMNNSAFSMGLSIATASGNVYVTGYFAGTVDFDPDALGTATLSSIMSGTLSLQNIFFAKYNSNGDYLWAKSLDGDGSRSYAMALDALGNIYLTGYFGGTTNFNPAGNTNLTSASGSNDIFFSKYDNNGNYLWAKSIYANSAQESYAIAVDASNNVYIAGSFFGPTTGAVDFDPGPGIADLTSVSFSRDVFFAKYSPCVIPTITAVSGSICTNNTGTYTMNVSGANSYTAHVLNQVTNSLTTSSNAFTITTSFTRTYVVTGSSLNCTSDAITATVTVNYIPFVNISYIVPAGWGYNYLCSGQTATLSANGAGTYTWANNSVPSATIYPSPSITTIYTVTGTSIEGCTQTATQNIIVYPTPTVTITASPSGSVMCAGYEKTLYATNNYQPHEYKWSNGVQGISHINVSPTITTIYTVTVSPGNCDGMATYTLQVDECTGIWESKSGRNELNIYPNPSSGEFFFKGNFEKNTKVVITNLLGQQIFAGELSDTTNSVHIQNGKGIYFYKIVSNNKQISNGKMIVE